MPQTTREKLLDIAETLFAERGFYGTSIANIASELELSKQAVLHHFSTKEKLYSQVLTRISQHFEQMYNQALKTSHDPTKQLIAYFTYLLPKNPQDTNRTKLLMRELLDNQSRIDTAKVWHLKPFLGQLISMVHAIDNWQDANDVETLIVVYQLLGAINYYGISEPTITGIFGVDMFKTLKQNFNDQLAELIQTIIQARNP